MALTLYIDYMGHSVNDFLFLICNYGEGGLYQTFFFHYGEGGLFLISCIPFASSVVNTSMIGALLKATGVVDIESLIEPLNVRFGRLAERNINAMKKAFDDTQIKE